MLDRTLRDESVWEIGKGLEVDWYERMTKLLLTTSAILELPVGLALLLAPSWTASTLLGASLEAPIALTVARLCGAGLLSLGVVCAMARRHAADSAASAVTAGLLIYNLGAAGVLAHSALANGLTTLFTWPITILHAAMAAWCAACLASVLRAAPRPLRT